jgi:hypothetical protein
MCSPISLGGGEQIWHSQEDGHGTHRPVTKDANASTRVRGAAKNLGTASIRSGTVLIYR